MRLFLCLCVFISVASAGFIGYPLGYYGSYSYPSVVSHPITTYAIAKPIGAYHGFYGYPYSLGSSYFSYNILPGNFLYPGVITYLPAVPEDKKKDKKKPSDKKEDKKDDKKEETTEESKKEESDSEEADLNE